MRFELFMSRLHDSVCPTRFKLFQVGSRCLPLFDEARVGPNFFMLFGFVFGP